ncbi:regulator of G-protein signaling rgs-2-like [Centruroides vittatus]|uniref:regulator of G-protein signaling rgs-2-like n=1 Tax=Centruroides vittatus TaxID=120091 RepID=UPI00350EF689
MSNQQCSTDKAEISAAPSLNLLSAAGTTSSAPSGGRRQTDNVADVTTSALQVAGDDTNLTEPCSETNKKIQDKDGMSSQRYHRLQKTCCLCWCCCCSCSCFSHVPRQPQISSSNDKNVDTIPTREEIVSWGESFDNLLKSPKGRKLFHDFLKYEYSEENLLFWVACEELKKETDPDIIEEKARIIYEDFISILSPKEVSLDSRVREKVNRNMIEPSLTTFDEAQMQIYTLMHRDSYPRFLNSKLYRSLIETNSNEEDSVT